MSPLRYPCLVLDHDDTAVDSTAHIHYPAFLAGVAALRPGHEALDMTLEAYFRMNHDPGLMPYYRDVLGFDDAEMAFEHDFWMDYVAGHVPAVYPGMKAIITRQKRLGGTVCVVSHSRRENILRDYAANGLPTPDLIYGSELPKDRWKPSPWPLEDIMDKLGLAPGQLLMVDDLPMGRAMALAAGVGFAAACWAHDIPEIEANMGQVRFQTPEELYGYLFG